MQSICLLLLITYSLFLFYEACEHVGLSHPWLSFVSLHMKELETYSGVRLFFLLKTAKESRFWGIPEKVMSYALTFEETTMPRSFVQIANGKDCWKL